MPTLQVSPINDANHLGLNYRVEATRLPWPSKITDVHVHLNNVKAAPIFFDACDTFGIDRVWSQTPLEEVDAIEAAYPGRVEFIAIPNYMARHEPDTFGSDWLKRMDAFKLKGARMAKFWAAPRGRDFNETFYLDHPTRIAAMKHARSLGMKFMTHVADPDTWFATVYKDARRYGTKASHYQTLEKMLDMFHDVPWMAAHMSGHPEDLDHLQFLIDRYPHFYIDTSATKWMVRELSKHPRHLRDFCRRNPGRVLWGTDIVASGGSDDFDLYASRFWCMRTLFETQYDGPSPVVDPDLSQIDPTLPAKSTAWLHGAGLDPAALGTLYHHAADRFMALPAPR
jgi:hypothetical protein